MCSRRHDGTYLGPVWPVCPFRMAGMRMPGRHSPLMLGSAADTPETQRGNRAPRAHTAPTIRQPRLRMGRAGPDCVVPIRCRLWLAGSVRGWVCRAASRLAELGMSAAYAHDALPPVPEGSW